MTNRIVPIVSIILGIFVLVASGFFFMSAKKNSGSGGAEGSPIIFYQQSTITSFDDSGQPIGRPALMRKLGFNGSPTRIFSLSQDNYIRSPIFTFGGEKILARYPKTFVPMNPSLAPEPSLELTLDLNGKELSRRDYLPTELDSYTSQTITSADGRIQAQTSIYCADVSTEDPCYNDAQLKVTEVTTGKTTILGGSDIAPDFPKPLFYQLWGISPDSSTIYLWVGKQQEAYLFKVVAVDADTGKVVKTVWESGGQPYAPEKGIGLIQTKDFGDHVYVLESDFIGSPSKILRFSLSTGEFQFVGHEPKGSGELIISPNEQYSVIRVNQSKDVVEILDFSTGQTRNILDSGDFLAWSHDDKYFAWAQWDYEGPILLRVWVQKLASGEKVEVFQQVNGGVRYTNASPVPSASVGETIYDFVGLY